MTQSVPVIFATGGVSFADHVATDMIQMILPSGDATVRIMLSLHQLSLLAHRAHEHMRKTHTHVRPTADVIKFPMHKRKGKRS